MFGKIKEGFVSVSVKSSTYLEVEKIRAKESHVREQMGEIICEMGQAVYEQWKTGMVGTDYIESMCGRIKLLENEAERYQEEVQNLIKEKDKILGVNSMVENKIPCSCGFLNEREARFCVKCGKPIPEQQKEQEPLLKRCPGCGAEVETDAQFCAGCGQQLRTM